MSNESTQATERLIKDLFLALLPIARREGITVKRMSHLLIQTLTRALDEEGLNRFEIMAEVGYSRCGIRLLLADDPDKHQDGTIKRFMNDWADDPRFPNAIPLEASRGPSFDRLHQRYGHDFTRPGLLKVLLQRGLVEVDGKKVRMLHRAVNTGTPIKRIDALRHALVGLLHTAAHNLARNKPSLLQEDLYSRAIPSDKIPEVREKIQAALKPARGQISQLLAAYGSGKKGAKDQSAAEIGVGLYCYESEAPATATLPRQRRGRKAAAKAKPVTRKKKARKARAKAT